MGQKPFTNPKLASTKTSNVDKEKLVETVSHGDANAAFELGRYYEELGNKENASMKKTEEDFFLEQCGMNNNSCSGGYKDAAFYYQVSAKLGNHEACRKLSRLYRVGCGVSESKEMEFHYAVLGVFNGAHSDQVKHLTFVSDDLGLKLALNELKYQKERLDLGLITDAYYQKYKEILDPYID